LGNNNKSTIFSNASQHGDHYKGAAASDDKSLLSVCELNRNVLRFNLKLKQSAVRILRTESGSSFQALGAATGKECGTINLWYDMIMLSEVKRLTCRRRGRPDPQNATFFLTAQWTRGNKYLTGMMAHLPPLPQKMPKFSPL